MAGVHPTRVLVALCVAAWSGAIPAGAQEATGGAAAAAQRPKVGLALSGGSAKGFAHIGVLEELERAGVPIDAIAGTSMGSIVGGLYAIGYTPAMLRRVGETEDWDGAFRTPVARSELSPMRKLGDGRYLLTVPIRGGRVELPSAFVGSQTVASILSRLVWAADTARDLRRLPIPFLAVATDLATGTAVPLDRGPLSVTMRASMALPGVFDPVTIDGRRLIDGGVARNLPVLDVRSLGADVVICVDVSNPLAPSDSLSTAIGILLQIVTYRMQESTNAERSMCDVLIEPDIRGLSSTAFGEAEQWIERGAAAARAAMPAVLAMLRARGIPPRAPRQDSVPVTPDAPFPRQLTIRNVVIRGDSAATRVMSVVDLQNKPMGADDAESLAARLFATGRYTIVVSRPAVSDAGVDLVLDVLPANPNHVGLGLRFDSRYKAALLFGAHINDWLGAGSSFSIDARLGEQPLVQARYLPAASGDHWLVRALSASAMETPLDIFSSERAVARAQVRLISAAAFAGTVYPANTITGVQLTAEVGRTSAEIAPIAIDAIRQTYYTVSLLSWTETFDRVVFPTRGVSVFAQTEVARRAIGSGADFSRSVLDVEARGPVHERTTVLARLTLGAARGDDLPVYDRFYLGGTIMSAVLPGRSFPFAALEPEARSGRALQMAEVGVQQRLGGASFLTVRGTVGNTFERWPTRLTASAYLGGASIGFGVLTPLGPATVTVAGRSFDTRPRVAAEFGYRF